MSVKSDTLKALVPYIIMLFAYAVLHTIITKIAYEGFPTFFDQLHRFVLQQFDADWSVLQEVPYHSPVMLVGALSHPIYVLGFVVLCVPLFFFYRRNGWTTINHHRYLRIFIMVVALVLVWDLTTYQLNYYVNEAHYFDRLLLLAFFVLLWWHPAFIAPFLFMAYLLWSQFAYPLPFGVTTVDKSLLFDLLVLFYVFVVVRIIFNIKTMHLVALLVCLVASNYFIPGVGKLLVSPHGYEWVFAQELETMVVNAQLKGWLLSWDQSTIDGLVQLVRQWRVPMLVGLMLVELGSVFIFYRRRVALYLLLGYVLLHVGIYTLSGIFFWKWMAVDLLLLWLIYKLPTALISELFSKRQWLISLCIILFSWLYFHPHRLSWFGTRMQYIMEYTVEGESGQWYTMERNNMAPFDMLFQTEKLHFLFDAPLLKISGLAYTFNYQLVQELEQIDATQALAYEKKVGVNRAIPEKEAAFVQFLQTYFQHRNQQMEGTVLNKMAPPRHFNNSAKSPYFRQEQVKTFKITLKKIYTENGNVEVLDALTWQTPL